MYCTVTFIIEGHHFNDSIYTGVIICFNDHQVIIKTFDDIFYDHIKQMIINILLFEVTNSVHRGKC